MKVGTSTVDRFYSITTKESAGISQSYRGIISKVVIIINSWVANQPSR